MGAGEKGKRRLSFNPIGMFFQPARLVLFRQIKMKYGGSIAFGFETSTTDAFILLVNVDQRVDLPILL
jgi:hypothetical protein